MSDVSLSLSLANKTWPCVVIITNYVFDLQDTLKLSSLDAQLLLVSTAVTWLVLISVLSSFLFSFLIHVRVCVCVGGGGGVHF